MTGLARHNHSTRASGLNRTAISSIHSSIGIYTGSWSVTRLRVTKSREIDRTIRQRWSGQRSLWLLHDGIIVVHRRTPIKMQLGIHLRCRHHSVLHNHGWLSELSRGVGNDGRGRCMCLWKKARPGCKHCTGRISSSSGSRARTLLSSTLCTATTYAPPPVVLFAAVILAELAYNVCGDRSRFDRLPHIRALLQLSRYPLANGFI